MNCPEKRALQRRCTAAWDAYEAALKRAGLPADGGLAIPRSVSELKKIYSKPISSPAYATALFLRGEHLKASRELSRHLSTHRC